MPITSSASSIKAGTVAFFAANSTPPGWLKANGATVSRTAYAALFLAIGTTYGAGDGATTFNLPDCRGEFLRGLDDGRGVDSARGIGTAQTDAFQGHKHEGLRTTYYNSGIPGGGNPTSSTPGTTSGAEQAAANGTPRTADETRPRNIAMLACIKF